MEKNYGEATNLPISIENDANCAALPKCLMAPSQSFSDVYF
ncbi:MAG: hypothetical protein ACLRQF_07885 [Thomasclavelia ramosa]